MPRNRKDGKAVKYPDRAIACPICGPEKCFVSSQGLIGHFKIVHGQQLTFDEIMALGDPGAVGGNRPSPEAATASPRGEIPKLKAEVEVLELASKKDKLLAGRVDPHIPDAAESAGLGPMSDKVKDGIQSRAFQLQQGPGSAVDDLTKTVNLISAIKGLDGTGSQKDGVLGVLRDLGINVGDLIKAGLSPPQTAPAGMRVGGLDLSGVLMTPEVLGKMIEYHTAKEKWEEENASRDKTTAGWMSFVEAIKPAITQWVEGKQVAGIGQAPGKAAAARPPGQPAAAPGSPPNAIPPSLVGEGRAPEVAPVPDEFLRCLACDQVIEIGGLSLGQIARCPTCGLENEVFSPDTPRTALPPLTDFERMQRDSQGGS